MTVDFSSILSTKVEEIEAAPIAPVGNYSFNVENFRFDSSTKKQTPYVEFTLKFLDAFEDVPVAQLEGVDLSNLSTTITFYLTEKALIQLRNFLEGAVGLDIADKTLDELIPQAVGQQVGGTVVHVPSATNADIVYANVTKTFAL